MTPEEKFNQDVWWTLQAIKKEQFSTPTGENVKINIICSSNRNTNSPPTDDISKYIRKLEELGAFRVMDKYDSDSYDPYYGANPEWENATEFLLAIKQPKFDELYLRYKELNTKLKSNDNGAILSLSAADRKKLCILEKLKEVWDLIPDKAKIPQMKYSLWLWNCGATHFEFEAILNIFKKEGLINSFIFMDDSK